MKLFAEEAQSDTKVKKKIQTAFITVTRGLEVQVLLCCKTALVPVVLSG